MHRRGWLSVGAMLFLSSAAWAHSVEFEFVAPAQAGARTDGGIATLQWTDSDALGVATYSLFATRGTYPPFEVPDAGGDLAIATSETPVANPVDLYLWNTAGVPAGCYQPYARLRDQMEGDTWRMGVGKVSVFAAGENVPPSVWITNGVQDVPTGSGTFTVRYKVDDPDDASVLRLKYLNATTRAAGVIADSIAIPAGATSGSAEFDIRAVPSGPYYLSAEVTAADGRSCTAYWQSYFYVSHPTDGGTGDGGPGPRPPARGCGCSGAPQLGLAGLAGWLARRRRALRGRGPGARAGSSAPASAGL